MSCKDYIMMLINVLLVKMHGKCIWRMEHTDALKKHMVLAI